MAVKWMTFLPSCLFDICNAVLTLMFVWHFLVHFRCPFTANLVGHFKYYFNPTSIGCFKCTFNVDFNLLYRPFVTFGGLVDGQKFDRLHNRLIAERENKTYVILSKDGWLKEIINISISLEMTKGWTMSKLEWFSVWILISLNILFQQLERLLVGFFTSSNLEQTAIKLIAMTTL